MAIKVRHVFKDGSTDPTQKSVPADIVRRVYEIMLTAEANKARRLAAENNQEVTD